MPSPSSSHALPPTRQCLRGNHTMPVTMFYANPGWAENAGRDVWCKDCAAKLTTRDGALRYFWDNHREWSEDAWLAALTKAREKLAKERAYQNASGERKLALEERFAVRELFALMNRKTFYKYHDPGDETFENALASGRFDEVVFADDDKSQQQQSKKKTYSSRFNGSFTEGELAYLEDFYDSMGGDDIDDYMDRNYIKKLAKASLAADKAQDDYNAGRCDFKVVADAMDNFDKLAKSSNLTAFQKKEKSKTAKTSWSEWSRRLIEKEIYAPKVEWPKDDIDKTLDEYQHILAAVKGGE